VLGAFVTGVNVTGAFVSDGDLCNSSCFLCNRCTAAIVTGAFVADGAFVTGAMVVGAIVIGAVLIGTFVADGNFGDWWNVCRSSQQV
jgi:hypothetical protein